MENMAEDKIIKEIEKEESKIIKELKKNPWIAGTFVFAVIALILLFVAFKGGGSISEKDASQKAVDFYKTYNGMEIITDSVKEVGSFYELSAHTADGQKGKVYISKDGEYLASSLVSISDVEKAAAAAANQTSATTVAVPAPIIPKSNKPVVDAYVFAYCPYGTQFEKALVPAYNLLKNKADINIVFIGAMHGEFEHHESLRQLCIQKNYGKDKLFAYLDKFLVNAAIGNCQGTDACVNPLIETIYTQIGIDKTKINTCITTDAEALYKADEQQAQSLGIGGSPTVTINGIEIGGNKCSSADDCNPGESCVNDGSGSTVCMLNRAANSVKTSICSAFNTLPSECNQTLSTQSTSSGFGSSAGSGSAASCG